MTNQEKAICEAYTGICFLAGDDRKYFYEYVAKICGRPILTHELPALSEAIKTLAKEDFIKVCRGEYDETRGLFLHLKRLKLARKIEKWLKTWQIENCALSVISYLYANDLINVEKAMRHIEEGENG